jgi:hypothetical protein
MTPQEAAELLLEILGRQQSDPLRVIAWSPQLDATPYHVPERLLLPPRQPQAKKRSFVAAPLASKKSKKCTDTNNTAGTTAKKGEKVDAMKK